MRKHRAALLAIALLVAACNRAPPPPPPPPLPIMGTQWRIAGGDESAPTLEFAENRASGYGGCNTWFAQVEVGETELHFGVVSSTRLMCSTEVMTAERAYFADLAATRTARIEGDTLTLLDETGAERVSLHRER